MMRAEQSLDSLQSASARLAQAQAAATGFTRINNPSDDPSGTSAVLKVHSAQAQNVQYGRNVNDGISWLAAVDSALSSSTSLLHRARDLTLQGSNDGAMSQTSKDSLATEIESIRESLLNEANTKYLGRSVFAGNSDAPQAFDEAYSYAGGSGQITRRVSENLTIRVDANGHAAFGEGEDSVFKLLDDIASDLRSGVNVGARITQIDEHMNSMLAVQSTAGAHQSTLLESKDRILSESVDLETQRGNLEDIDPAIAIMDLQKQQLAYQAALSVTASATKTNLMDFLR